MGRIVQLKGRHGYYAEYWHPGQRRNIRKRAHGDRRQRARFLLDCEAKAQREAEGLGDAATNQVDIEELIVAWHHYNTGRTRPSTWKSYALGLGQVLDFLETCRRPRRVSDLRLADVEAFKADALGRGLTARTVAMRVGPLRQMLTWALREGRIAANPLAAWRAPRGEHRIVRRALTAFEFQQLLNASPPDLADVWRFFAATGLRAGEVTTLEWTDLDVEGRRLHVRGEVSKSRHDHWVYYGEAVAAILARLRLHLAERPRTEAARRLIFASPKGAAWGERLSRRLQACRKAAGLPWFDLHCLRHTYASHIIAGGADAVTTSKQLGHSNPIVTMTVYAHAFEAKARAAAAVADDLAGMVPATSSARTARTTGTGG